MRAHRASLTAHGVAMCRAAHQWLDAPRVLDDPIAVPIVGMRALAPLQAGGRLFDTLGARTLRAYVVARSRFAEDTLATARRRGVRQYVLLGAGLDTFAYRQPPGGDAREGLRVFEVDHPATQAWKRAQLGANGIAVPPPPALTYVPVDFESQSLPEALQAAGFDHEVPAFFAWLGVTMYLTPADVSATLGAIASQCAPGSGLVFDYVTPMTGLDLGRRTLFGGLAVGLAALGEPWKGHFAPGELQATLSTLGFGSMEDADMAQIEDRYFGPGMTRLGLGGLVRMVTAWR